MLIELINLFGLYAPGATVVEFIIVVLAAGFIGQNTMKLLEKEKK